MTRFTLILLSILCCLQSLAISNDVDATAKVHCGNKRDPFCSFFCVLTTANGEAMNDDPSKIFEFWTLQTDLAKLVQSGQNTSQVQIVSDLEISRSNFTIEGQPYFQVVREATLAIQAQQFVLQYSKDSFGQIIVKKVQRLIGQERQFLCDSGRTAQKTEDQVLEYVAANEDSMQRHTRERNESSRIYVDFVLHGMKAAERTLYGFDPLVSLKDVPCEGENVDPELLGIWKNTSDRFLIAKMNDYGNFRPRASGEMHHFISMTLKSPKAEKIEAAAKIPVMGVAWTCEDPKTKIKYMVSVHGVTEDGFFERRSMISNAYKIIAGTLRLYEPAPAAEVMGYRIDHPRNEAEASDYLAKLSERYQQSYHNDQVSQVKGSFVNSAALPFGYWQKEK